MSTLLYSIPDVMRELRISRSAVYRLFKETHGGLVVVKAGRRTLVTSASVHAFAQGGE